MSLFVREDFVSHSGLRLEWKIDCDALTQEDLNALAYVISRQITFGSVIGVPTGGLQIAHALRLYSTEGPTLVVDDVLTTGASMEEVRKQVAREYPGAIGVVLFARGECPCWVTPVFELNPKFDHHKKICS